MFRDSGLVAVGGLNIDPYTSDSQVGRLRHVYVKKNERRKGYASHLVRALVHLAHPSFHTVRLLTDTDGGAAFYESLGFERVSSTTASHELILRP
jgi:N-acetylglutamate synthase-like GNAT family acetyltransferase